MTVQTVTVSPMLPVIAVAAVDRVDHGGGAVGTYLGLAAYQGREEGRAL